MVSFAPHTVQVLPPASVQEGAFSDQVCFPVAATGLVSVAPQLIQDRASSPDAPQVGALACVQPPQLCICCVSVDGSEGFSVGRSVEGLVSGGSVGFTGDVGLGSVGACVGFSGVSLDGSSGNGVCVSLAGFSGTVTSLGSGSSASCEIAGVDASSAVS